LDLLALLLQLQSTVTAHNQCLAKTRSIPYWTASVFSSAVTNDERRIPCESESESYVTTDAQPVSLSWNKDPSGSYDQIFITCVTVTVLFLLGALSDERAGLSFVFAAGPCQRSLSRVRVPWDPRPYFTVSHLKLPFSSPPTTRRVTVEVFDPAE
jgi:hypothetical protein